MAIQLPLEIIAKYASRNICHLGYDISVIKYHKLKVHANGEVPVELIECRRPSEPVFVKDYRIKIYSPITKIPVTKVITSLSKIRRSPDWAIKYPSKRPSIISEEESLQNYMENNFPFSFISLTNWMFSVGLKQYLLDANAVILVRPVKYDIEANEYFRPFPYIFNSPSVLDYRDGEYAVLLSDKKCSYDVVNSNGIITTTMNDGLILYVVDDEYIRTYYQNATDYTMKLQEEFEHNLGYMPAFKVPGQFFDVIEDCFVNESRISGMIPGLDEAARQYSDLQAEIVQHVHSQQWQYNNIDCVDCNGTGRQQLNDEETCTCHKCKGIGKISVSPYDIMVLTPPNNIDNTANIPTPPAGYVQKSDVALMVDKMNGLVNEQKYNALSAINMEFLAEVPIAESGTAKEIDREEVNNFVHIIAEDVIYMMDRIYYMSNDYRHIQTIPDNKVRQGLLPIIPVPAVFDLLSSNYLLDEIQKAKNSNLNPLIIMALEAEYAAKKFYTEPAIAQELLLSFRLDPVPATTDENKMMRLQNKGITQIDYIISSNIISFIRRAILDDPKFPRLDYETQMEILEGYAQEIIDDNSVKKSVIPVAPPDEVPVDPSGIVAA